MTVMTPINGDLAKVAVKTRVWALLTFDRLITGQVLHLVYWAGLSIIVVAAFAVIGASIGVAIREPGLASFLLAIPVLVVGLLVVGVLGLLWRAFCEFYVVVVRISDDLSALRLSITKDSSGDAI
jgi:hypothetical protein